MVNNYLIRRCDLIKKYNLNHSPKYGFITLECVVSMFILSIIVYMVMFSTNNSLNLLLKNQEYSNMLSLSENYISKAKCEIKYNNEFKDEVFSEGDFKISKKITKKEGYYNCYKITLEVKSKERSVKLQSYATKK